jgi:hypothetical protein
MIPESSFFVCDCHFTSSFFMNDRTEQIVSELPVPIGGVSAVQFQAADRGVSALHTDLTLNSNTLSASSSSSTSSSSSSSSPSSSPSPLMPTFAAAHPHAASDPSILTAALPAVRHPLCAAFPLDALFATLRFAISDAYLKCKRIGFCFSQSQSVQFFF